MSKKVPRRYSMYVSVDPISGMPYVESKEDESGAWTLAPRTEWVVVRRGGDTVGYFLRGNTAFRIVRVLRGRGKKPAASWVLHGMGIGSTDILGSFESPEQAKARLLELVKGMQAK